MKIRKLSKFEPNYPVNRWIRKLPFEYFFKRLNDTIKEQMKRTRTYNHFYYVTVIPINYSSRVNLYVQTWTHLIIARK